MAKWCLVVCRKEKTDLLKNELLNSDEAKLIEGSHGFDYFVIFKGVNDYPVDEKDFKYLLGYAIDHENSLITFNPYDIEYNGEKSYEGAFVRLNINKKDGCDELSVGFDHFGLQNVVYTKEPDFFCASDSLTFIANVRKVLGFDNNIDDEVFLSRCYFINAITAQPINAKLMVKNCFYLRPSESLFIRLGDDGFNFECLKNNFFTNDFPSYKDGLRAGVSQICGVLSGLLKEQKINLSVDLSGGMDSRLILGLVMRASDNNQEFNVSSDKKQVKDFGIASDIAERYELKLNSKPFQKRVKNNPLALFYSGNLGFYDPPYIPASHGVSNDPQEVSFKLGGFSAELYKGNYGFRSLNSIGSSVLDEKQHAALLSELNSGLMDMSFDYESSFASEFHYLLYRNPVHSGRAGLNSFYSLRPLNNRLLVSLSYSLFNNFFPPKKGGWNMVKDMMVLADPELASLPYDAPAKNITKDEARTRFEYFGGFSFSPYSVHKFGNVIPSGQLEISKKWAEKAGFSGKMDSNSVGFLIDNAPVPEHLYDYVREIKESVINIEDGVGRSHSKSSMAVGKILGLYSLV